MTKHQVVKEKGMTRRIILGILLILVATSTACGSDMPAEASDATPPVAPIEASSATLTGPTAEPAAEPVAEASSATPTEPAAEPAAELVAAAGSATPTKPSVEPTVEPPAETGGTASTLDEDYPDAVPVFMQLVVGTMLLEETPSGVTAEQVRELLPLWQMLRAVRRGDAPPSLEEIDAVTDQIMAVMKPEQLGIIKRMQLTQDDVRVFTQNNNVPQSGQGSGGGQMGSGGGDTQNLSPEERRRRMITGGGKNLVDELIRRLEMWAG